jgi:hypothetical protein
MKNLVLHSSSWLKICSPLLLSAGRCIAILLMLGLIFNRLKIVSWLIECRYIIKL